MRDLFPQYQIIITLLSTDGNVELKKMEKHCYVTEREEVIVLEDKLQNYNGTIPILHHFSTLTWFCSDPCRRSAGKKFSDAQTTHVHRYISGSPSLITDTHSTELSHQLHTDQVGEPTQHLAIIRYR